MAIAEAHICAQFGWDIWKPRNWSVWEFGAHGTYLYPQRISLVSSRLSYQLGPASINSPSLSLSAYICKFALTNYSHTHLVSVG